MKTKKYWLTVALMACLADGVVHAAQLDNELVRVLTISKGKVWVASESAAMYKQPDINAERTWQTSKADQMLVDLSKLKTAPVGWLPIVGTGGSPAGAGLPPMPDSWIKVSDVVTGLYAKKVIDCWPIKSLLLEAGDSASEFHFTKNGTGWVRNSYNADFPHEVLKNKFKIYIEQGIIKFTTSAPSGRQNAVAAFDEKSYAITFDGRPPSSVSYRGAAELSGCNGISTEKK